MHKVNSTWIGIIQKLYKPLRKYIINGAMWPDIERPLVEIWSHDTGLISIMFKKGAYTNNL